MANKPPDHSSLTDGSECCLLVVLLVVLILPAQRPHYTERWDSVSLWFHLGLYALMMPVKCIWHCAYTETIDKVEKLRLSDVSSVKYSGQSPVALYFPCTNVNL